MCRLKNRIGERYGRLIVVAYAGSEMGGKCRRTLWACICDCGTETTVRATNLNTGQVKSCGCLFTETIVKRNTTHGQTGSPEHKTWIAMLGRCYEKNHSSYHRYGACGIGVCDRWRESFPLFLADVGSKPTLKHSLDRIDNERGYEPNNVRWATSTEQANNRRSNRWIEWRGQTKTLAEWSRTMGLPWWTIPNRLRRGWSLERAMTVR